MKYPDRRGARARLVVAECVQVARDAELGAHARVPVGHGARVSRAVAQGSVGEQERIVRRLQVKGPDGLLVALTVLDQHLHRVDRVWRCPHLLCPKRTWTETSVLIGGGPRWRRSVSTASRA